MSEVCTNIFPMPSCRVQGQISVSKGVLCNNGLYVMEDFESFLTLRVTENNISNADKSPFVR